MRSDDANFRATDCVHELEGPSGVRAARREHALFSAAHLHRQTHGIVGEGLLHFFRGDAMPRDVADVGFVPVEAGASAMYVFSVLQNCMACGQTRRDEIRLGEFGAPQSD